MGDYLQCIHSIWRQYWLQTKDTQQSKGVSGGVPELFSSLLVNLYQQNLLNKGDSYSVYACHFLKLLISAKFPLIDQIKFLITCVAAGAG